MISVYKEKVKNVFLEKKRMMRLALLVLCVTLGCAAPAFAAEPAGSTVRVGCFPLNGFFNYKDDAVADGYGADYTESIFEYAGLRYEYISYSSWVEALDALSKNEIDMLAPSQHTPERDELYAFDSFPIGTEYGALLTLATNDALVYEDFSSFTGMKVGVVPSLVFLDDFKEYEARKGFSVQLVDYKDTAALVAALNAGDVDAALVNMMVKTDAMKLLARFGAAPIYYMFNPEATGLCEKINLAIDQLTSEHPELQSELSGKYFSDFNNLPFTKEELDYIANSGTLNVACEEELPPFAYTDADTGELTGVSVAMAERAAQIAGLNISLQAMPVAADEQAIAAQSTIAVICGAEADNAEKQSGAHYTQSYLTAYKYFVGESSKAFDETAKARVACVNTSRVQLESLQTAYPSFTFVQYTSPEVCIKALRAGEVDYFLSDRYSMESILTSPRNSDLTIFPYQTVASQLCFQVMPEGAEGELLTSILNKAVSRISQPERDKLLSDFTEEIAHQYTVSDFIYQYRFQLLIAALLLLAVIVALSLIASARRKIRQAIQEDEIKLRNITNNIKGGVVVLNANKGLTITFANNGFLELIGCDRKQLEQNGSYLAYVHPDDLVKIQEAIDTNLRELSLRLRVLKTDGTYVPTLFNCTAGEVKNGSKELYCVILDLTEQEKLTEQLRMDKRRTELILSCVDEVFYEVNLQNNDISTSTSFYEKFGWTLPTQLPEQRADYIVKTWETDTENTEKIAASTRELLAKKEVVSVIVKLKCKKEKRMVWCEIVQHPVLASDGTIASVIGLIRDVDSQVSERQHLIEQAQHDPLTGLYNKETFEIKVTETLADMPDKNHSMIFIDLDHFKSLNDTLGHMQGDKAICEAADKLRVIFSSYDILARFGGDEFCIFVKNIPEKTIRRKLDWMIEKLRADYHGHKGDVSITCSCGVVCTDGKQMEYDVLMKQADKALYQSKENGRNRYTFFAEKA